MKSFKITGNHNEAIEYIHGFIKNTTMCVIDVDNIDTDDNELIIEVVRVDDDHSYQINKNKLVFFLSKKIDKEFIKHILFRFFDKHDVEYIYSPTLRNANSNNDAEDMIAANYDKDYRTNEFTKLRDEAEINKYTVKKSKGSNMYYVGRRFNDEYKYVGESLVKAVTVCQKYTGMKVFNEDGIIVYKSTLNKINVDNVHKEVINREAILNTSTGMGIYMSNMYGQKIHIPNGIKVKVLRLQAISTQISLKINNSEYFAVVKQSDLKL